jgi:hypothetical protein
MFVFSVAKVRLILLFVYYFTSYFQRLSIIYKQFNNEKAGRGTGLKTLTSEERSGLRQRRACGTNSDQRRIKL